MSSPSFSPYIGYPRTLNAPRVIDDVTGVSTSRTGSANTQGGPS
jgi:hypothetical protein